jgi:hypothetical protein
VLGFHPFFDENKWNFVDFIALREFVTLVGFFFAFQIGFEVLKESDFFLKFRRIISELYSLDRILLFAWFSLKIVEIGSCGVENYFGAIVEKHSTTAVAQNVSHSIFAAIIDPLFHPNIVFPFNCRLRG